MRFTKVGRFYRMSRITGPSHNLLGLSVSRAEPSEIAMLKLREPEAGPLLDEERLKQAVLAGVDQANAALGTAFRVDGIQYVPDDTPNLAIYSWLAKSLIEGLVQSGELSSDAPQRAHAEETDLADPGPIAAARPRSHVPDGL